MVDSIATADLRRIDLFAELDEAALAEVASRAEDRRLGAREVLVALGSPPDTFFVLLDGRLEGLAPSDGGGERLDKLHVAPTFLGAIPILTDSPWAVTMRAVEGARVACLDADAFRRLMHEHRAVERAVMRAFQPTFQRFEGLARQREKLAALGTMAAGLAHELNNPAAAARRSAADLGEALAVVQNTIGVFVETGVERDAAERLVHLQREAIARAAVAAPLDALARGEREDVLADELERLGLAEPWTLAEPLAAADLDAAWLAEVERHAGAATEAAVRWVAATLVAQGPRRRAARQHRPHLPARLGGQGLQLHGPRRGAGGRRPRRPGEHADDARPQAQARLGDRGARLRPHAAALQARGSELNQVWTNLIDNAIDAVDGSGTVTLTTRRAGDALEVSIADDGPGIAPGIRDRIFEPFFTTKDVGQGTGLGLQTARNIVVDRHGGEIRVDSDDAGTRVRVTLPVRRAA
jgi:signal transduction histidine kinase